MNKKIIFPLFLCALLFVSIAFSLEKSIERIYEDRGTYDIIYDTDIVKTPIYTYTNTTIRSICKYNETLKGDYCTEPTTRTDVSIDSFTITEVKKDRVGVRILDADIEGNINIVNGKIIEWTVDIGDRNFKEFGECFDYEIEKGVCSERALI